MGIFKTTLSIIVDELPPTFPKVVDINYMELRHTVPTLKFLTNCTIYGIFRLALKLYTKPNGLDNGVRLAFQHLKSVKIQEISTCYVITSISDVYVEMVSFTNI